MMKSLLQLNSTEKLRVFHCVINAVILFLGVKAKVGSSPFLKCATPHPLIMWHPYARHYYFCVTTEKEQQKWYMVLQDCVRHSNNGESCYCNDRITLYCHCACATKWWVLHTNCAWCKTVIVGQRINNKLEESMQSRREADVRQAANRELLLSVLNSFIHVCQSSASSLCCKQRLDLHVAFLLRSCSLFLLCFTDC